MRSKASILILLAVLLMILMYFAFDRHASQSLSASQSTQIVIVGPKQDLTAKKLYTTALSLAVKDTNIIWWDKSEGPLTNTKIQYPWLDKSAVYVCHHYECSLPMFDTQELIEFIKHVNTTKQPSSMIHLSQPQAEMNHHDAADHLLKSESWILTVLGFIGIGLLLSFSPCILPLIPIMASIIVGQTIGVKKSRTFLLCLACICKYICSSHGLLFCSA